MYDLVEPERQPDWPVGFPRGARASLFFYQTRPKGSAGEAFFTSTGTSITNFTGIFREYEPYLKVMVSKIEAEGAMMGERRRSEPPHSGARE